ncbi:hypothetical protein D3C85_1606240 [compost metagenome]
MASGVTDSSIPKIFSESAALLTARPSRNSRISSTARSRPVSASSVPCSVKARLTVS